MLAAFFCVFYLFSIDMHPGVMVGALCMAFIGMVDDWRPFLPLHKFVLTVLVAGVAVYLGICLNVFGIFWMDGLLTLLWMVWLCHAFNVFDMADGLSAGGGAIAALSLWGMGAGDWSLVMAGGLLGFLIHNGYPARLYMGDAGSLMFGFGLSAMGVLIAREQTVVLGWVGPFLAVGAMSFEAVFIGVMRFAKGRPISRASRDHVAHRLIKWGRSVPGAVGLIWVAGGVLGGLGAMVVQGYLSPLGALGFGVMGAWGVGWLLARVDMEGDGVDGRPAGLWSKNWLIHRLMRQGMASVAGSIHGRLLDVGCGTRPYAPLFAGRVSRYIGVERDRARYVQADIWGDVLFLPVKDNSFDTVLCNQVLEHVPEPQHMMGEMARVLKTGGTLILTAPHIWELHEVPHDYYRYTPYGLRYLAEKAGLIVVDVRALAGFWVTAGARFCYYLARFDRGVLALLIKPMLLAVQLGAWVLDKLHRVESEAWNFLLIAQKKQ